MSANAKVSVVVPVYNASKWLPDSFCSFEQQTYPNIEWILVDDGSTDDSLDRCLAWCSADARRRRIVHKVNGGSSSARNYGLDFATGEYVLFWDCDDTQSPDAVEKMAKGISGKGCVSVCALRRVESDGCRHDLFACDPCTLGSADAIEKWLRGGVSTGPYSKLVPRDLLVANNIRFEVGVINEDVLWTARVLAAADSVTFLGIPLYCYISREGSVTRGFDARFTIVFDNCNKLENFVLSRYPSLSDAVAEYSARSCWSVILAASRGHNRRQFPDVYARSMDEFALRREDISRYCHSPKDRVLQILVGTRIYGLLRR